MNRNVYGVILFSLIVGTAMFIGVFYAEPEIFTVERPVVTVENSRVSCHKKKFKQDSEEIKVTQAYLNKNKNEITLNYFADISNYDKRKILVTFNFFVKNGAKTSFVASEKTPFAQAKSENILTVNYSWLNKLNDNENLYVIAESNITEKYRDISEPKFDETQAIPVLTKER